MWIHTYEENDWTIKGKFSITVDDNDEITVDEILERPCFTNVAGKLFYYISENELNIFSQEKDEPTGVDTPSSTQIGSPASMILNHHSASAGLSTEYFTELLDHLGIPLHLADQSQ